MVDSRKAVLELIEKYTTTVRRAVFMLSNEYDLSTPLRSVNRGQIPREGTLKNGIKFYFHGIGCSLEGAELTVSFDFGPEGRHDGFSYGALARFAEDNDLDIGLSEPQSKDTYDQLISDGTVVAPNWDPGRHLNYLKTTTTTP